MTMCGQYVTRYVGKGAERIAHTGQCVLDQGHDGLCLPPSLTGVTGVPTEELRAVQEALKSSGWQTCEEGTLETIESLVMGWGQ